MVAQRGLLAGLLLVLLVPVSSLLGLARAMQEFGGRVFLDVWKANLWGDLVFTLGTLAAGAAAGALVTWAWRGPGPRRPLALLAAPLSLLLHWSVYAAAWSFTGPADGFWSWSPSSEAGVWEFTWKFGWPGLLFCALAAPLGALVVELLRPAARASSNAVA